MFAYLKKIVALDYRSLAALRIFVGLTIFLDLIQRTQSLTAHYTDRGVLPRTELFRLWNEPTFWSFYNMNGTAFFAGMMFIIAGIFAIMMMVGYRTRIATVVSFVLLISLHNRNSMVLQGGDVALRCVLFFMMFMPIGKRFSLDGVLGNESAPKLKEFISPIGAAYIMQFLLIWVMSGVFKTGTPWVHDFTAVSMALMLDSFTTGFGNFLRTMPHLMQYFTLATIIIERYVFVVFFSPFYNGYFRILGLFLFTALVVGFNASFRLGLFGMIMFSISLGLLPSVFWDKIIYRIHNFISNKSKRGMTIFYDGDCGFCSRMANATRRILFLHPDTVVVMASVDDNAKNLMHTAHSWVVRDSKGRSYTGFRAFVALMQSAFLYRIVAPIFLLKPIMYIGEIAYKAVSHNRPMKCIVHVEEKTKTPFEKNIYKATVVFIVSISIIIFIYNLKGLPDYSNKFKSSFFKSSLMVFRLDQKWNMFSPYPTTEDGFYVIPGTLRDGTEVDVYTGHSPVNYSKPHLVSYTYQDQRWQKYMMNLWLKDYSKYRLGYGQYLCREWNKSNPYDKNLMTFKITYMLEETDFNTLVESVPEPVVIWEHDCFLKE